MEIEKYTELQLEWVAEQLIKEYSSLKVWCFDAEMGSGKTTLIKQICNNLGVIDQMSSPTFSIVNEYVTAKEDFIYHFDFYRLKQIDEAYDIGTEDYLFSGNLCLLEWPEIIEPILPEQYLKISINLVDDFTRSLTAKPNEPTI